MTDRNDMDNNLVDLDFSANSEMNRIRENERIEREKRMRHAAKLRRAEIIRRKKIERIKTMVTAWSVLIFAVIAVVALVIGVISLFKKDDSEENKDTAKIVSKEESSLLYDFAKYEGAVYSVDNTNEQNIPLALNSMYEGLTAVSLAPYESPVCGSELSMLTEAFLWNGTKEAVDKIKETVRDYPMYSNGYVWTVENSMKHPVVNSYLYDTNASYLSAVSDICLWEGSVEFLNSTDVTGEEKGDVSAGMTVGEKLEKVISHFFDSENYIDGGGVRYNAEDGLVYVLTSDNDGTESGKPSNVFYNYRFGYIDVYNNLVFNAAMKDVSALYTLAGDKEKAEKYASVAEENKKAINEKLYDKKLGRYIGCIDKDGVRRDGGFTVINLMAISLGVADKQQSESILSWVEGTRNIKSDTHKSANVYQSLSTPAFSTVTAEDEWWYNAGGNCSVEDEAAFGKYWMNGGASALAGNYYLLSGKTTSKADVRKRVYDFAAAFGEGKLSVPEGERGEPELHYALFSSNTLREVFGISTDGKNLNIAPLFSDGENAGINNVAFSGRLYDVLFHKDSVYVTCDEKAAVRLKIGSFEKNQNLLLVTVEDGKIFSEESVSADKSGVLSVSAKFGGNSYIRIDKIKTQE